MIPLAFLTPEEFIKNPNHYDEWLREKKIPLEERGLGTQECWIYQTWALLKHAGLNFPLLTKPPEEGILIMHSDQSINFLKDGSTPSKKLFIVNIVADTHPHPEAHLNIVQNKAHHAQLPYSCFIPHWPEPNLIERNPLRGLRFENVVFFGRKTNIAPALLTEEWSDHLRRSLGLYFHFQEESEWHDYSQVDCAIAIRDFKHGKHFKKPATKLYNAWLAGVPFIGGPDSAFSSEGRCEKNYLLSTSFKEVLKNLKRLQESNELRLQLIAEGKKAGHQITQAATLERWKQLLLITLPELALRWHQKSSSQQKRERLLRKAVCFFDYHFVK